MVSREIESTERTVGISESDLWEDPGNVMLHLLHEYGEEVHFSFFERPVGNLIQGTGCKQAVFSLESGKLLVIETNRLQEDPFSEERINVWLARSEKEVSEGLKGDQTYIRMSQVYIGMWDIRLFNAPEYFLPKNLSHAMDKPIAWLVQNLG